MSIEDILNPPGRNKRPAKIVVVLRGLPGSGKSFAAKLIKEREIKNGGQTPRILALDDYFITKEIKKIVKDPVSGKEVETKNMEYEYDQDLESKYRNDLTRIFKKTVDNGYHTFIIIDCINDRVKYFKDITDYAVAKKFTVYIAETECNITECCLNNIHNRSRKDIEYIQKNWEPASYSFIRLDLRTLLQDEAIQDVEMEDVSDIENVGDDENLEQDNKSGHSVEVIDLEEEDEPTWAPSKWETSEEKLNKLDGLVKKKKPLEETDENKIQSMGGWLKENLPDDYMARPEEPGKKRVRWADIEERREQERAREIGFVVGQTNWDRMTDPTFGGSALTRTKFI